MLLFCAGQAAAETPPLKEQPIPGWPELRIETHYVPRIAMRGSCFPAPLGMPIPQTSANGCARPDFWRGVCDVYIDVGHIADSALYARQMKRCRGYDVRGSDQFAEALRAWRDYGQNRYGHLLDFDSMLFVTSPLDCEGEKCVELR